MRKPILLFILAIVFIIGIAFSKTFSQSASKEVKKLQDLYAKRDYLEGYELGKELVKKFPANPEIQYWFAANGSRNLEGRKIVDFAEELVKEKGENRWTLLTLTAALTMHNPAEAIKTGEKLIKIAPNDEEAIFVYSAALFQNRKYADSLNFLTQNESKINDKSRFLTEKGVFLFFAERDKKDKGQVQLGYDVLAQAVKADPLSVNANFYYGYYLIREKRFEEAIPFLKKAFEVSPNGLSPNGYNLSSVYWTAIKSQTNKNDEQKEAEFDTAIDSYLTQSKRSPDALLKVWRVYRDSIIWQKSAKPKDLQKMKDLEKTIFQKYPNTKYDEEIAFVTIRFLFGKYFLSNEESAKNLEINNKPKNKRLPEDLKFLEDYEARNKLYKAEDITLKRAFIKRPQNFDKEKLGEISFGLLQLLESNKEAKDEEIADLIKKATDNYKSYWRNLNSDIAAILVRRQNALPNSLITKEAEKYARIGMAEADKRIGKLPKDARPGEINEIQLRPLISLAQALINNEKLDEAEQLLTKISRILGNSGLEDYQIETAKYDEQIAWAKFYTAKKDWEKAEVRYINVYKDDEDGKNAFEHFYEKRFGKKAGFDAYYIELQKKLKVRAKVRMAESRIKNAQDAVPFSLKNLEDKTVSFADLKGKVIVINVWGAWCAPCVAEMNELQEFFDKYKNDTDVAVLTIDQGDKLEDVKKFMTERKLTIPVLMNDSYLDKTPQFSKGGAFPTTFFIDKNGKVAFVKTGNSGNLVEEFSWRVDILKADK